ncbi:MAG: hypothetical protein IJK67_03520 [Bacilli bacterium]|nr:hypothetical protein [Bacilli bacterium]
MNKKDKGTVSYVSDNDKLYVMQKKKILNTKKWLLILMVLAVILLPLAESLLIKSLDLKKQEVIVEYVEKGDVDYKVYLKQNNYYKEKYLGEGMEYVANIINTINPDFRYEIHATDNLDMSYAYKITATLLISKDSDSQPLYTRTFDLIKKDVKVVNSNNLTISENLIIDYDEYNSLVNRYKKDFGISAYSKLVINMDINIVGKHSNNEDQMFINRTLQASIPLSEQTIRISIDTEEINNNGLLFAKGKITVSNILLFVVALVSLGLVLLLLITSIRLYIKFKRRNIYYITLNKYINEYDKLVINGSYENTNIDETKFDNVVKIEKFEELVDAAENLSLPILFYEVIPGELSFFVVTNDKTLYKYTLDKAALTKKEKDEK